MSINKKTFNNIALADNSDELIKRVLDALKEVSTPKPGGGITPSIPPGHHDPYCRDIFSHMRGLSSIREITQYFMQSLGELRRRSENFCSSGGQESNFEGFIDALQGFLCAVKYITRFIPGSIMPGVLADLLQRLRPVNGLDHLDDSDMSYLYAMLCMSGVVDQIVLLDETYDTKAWEDLFNIITLTPQLCPTSVVDQVLLGLGELVEPETLDLIGEIMMALATALAAAAVLLATLPAGIAAIAYAAAVLAARQAATAALAALVAAGLITQAQADGLVDDMVDGVEACEIEDPVDPTDIGVEEEVKEWTCCLPGGAEPEEGWDEDDCLNNGGELFGPMHMCEIHLPDDEK